MPDRCPRGHLLDEENRYEEATPGLGGRVVVRCRTCRREQRVAQRRRSKGRPAGRLELADLARHQHPTPADIEAAMALWRSGAAGTACRKANIGAETLARITGSHPSTARSWLKGAPIQRRYLEGATAVLLALGTLHPKAPTGPTGNTGDSILLVGGGGDRNGPWHHSPPHDGHQISLRQWESWYGNGLVGAKFYDWWPCAGFVSSLTESHRLLTQHGYTPDNPRVIAYASRCHGTPRWRRDCPNGDDCKGVHLNTAAWATHMADLYDGAGCTPQDCPAK